MHGIIFFHALPCMESYDSMRGIAWKVCRSWFHAWNRMESYGSYASMHGNAWKPYKCGSRLNYFRNWRDSSELLACVEDIVFELYHTFRNTILQQHHVNCSTNWGSITAESLARPCRVRNTIVHVRLAWSFNAYSGQCLLGVIALNFGFLFSV